MEVWKMGLWANITGLLGVLLLAIPALHVNHYALLIARISAPKVNVQSDAAARRRKELVNSLATLKSRWSPWKAWCLIGGTVCAAASYTLAIVARL
jgi:hypothetical protein